MTAPPDARTAVAASRVAREAGQLRIAQRALDRACDLCAQAAEPQLLEEVALESALLAGALANSGARLGALAEWLRARRLGAKNAAGAVGVLLTDYPHWRPQPEPIGVAGDLLKAAATGAFAVAPQRMARILSLSGQITADGGEAFRRAMEMSADGVSWLLIDMAELSYVGSSALAHVVKQAERLRRVGGGVCLYSMSSSLKILVEMLGVNTSVVPVEGVTEALEQASGV